MPSWYSDNGVPGPTRPHGHWFWIHFVLAFGSCFALLVPYLPVRLAAAVSVVINCAAMTREA